MKALIYQGVWAFAKALQTVLRFRYSTVLQNADSGGNIITGRNMFSRTFGILVVVRNSVSDIFAHTPDDCRRIPGGRRN